MPTMRSGVPQRAGEQGLLFETVPRRVGRRAIIEATGLAERNDPSLRRLIGKVVALDVETTGLDRHRGDRIFCWAYFTEKGEYGFMYSTPESLRWVAALFADPDKHLVFHNAKFDVGMFKAEGIDVLNAKAKVHCTLVLAKMFNGMLPQYDLRWLAIFFLDRNTDDKDEIKNWLKANSRRFVKQYGRKPNFSDAPTEIVSRRAIWDVESTLFLWHFLYPRVMKTCPDLYETERQLILVTVDMEDTGVLVDLTRARLLRKLAKRWLVQIQKQLDELILPLTVYKKKRGELVPIEVTSFNYNSTTKQVPAAFEKLGIPLRFKTKPKKGKKGGKPTGGGNWCFDEYAMIRYVSLPLSHVIRESGENGWPAEKFYAAVQTAVRHHNLHRRELLPPLILKARQLGKMISTYYDHIIGDAIDVHTTPEGREVGTLHFKFNPSEARTGRFSAGWVQQAPRILGPRECVIPRKGRRNWHFDYEQVEMRMFCHFAKDPDMAKAIEDDVHMYVATQIYDLPREQIIKEQRKRAKSIGFGIIYGARPPKIAETMTRDGLITTVTESSLLCSRYHKRFPSVRRTTQDFEVQLNRHKFVTNPFGRRYFTPSNKSYTVLNYMCQGTSADIMKAAMVKVWRFLRKQSLKSRILMTVHDELGIEIPRTEEPIVVPMVIKLMENLTDYYVPVTVDAEVCPKRWSHKIKPKKLGCDFIPTK